MSYSSITWSSTPTSPETLDSEISTVWIWFLESNPAASNVEMMILVTCSTFNLDLAELALIKSRLLS